VFAALADFQASLAWRNDITSIERGADRNGKPVWIEQGSHGPLPLEVTASEPARAAQGNVIDAAFFALADWL